MSSSDGHPTYPNPTIVEAICEVVFRPAGGVWSPLTLGAFYHVIQSDFPVIEAVPLSIFNIQLGPASGVAMGAPTPAPQMLRYRHATRPLLIQLSENRISVNILAAYPGWEKFRADIGEAWEKLSSVAHPEAIIRVGLRYINRIERTVADETFGAWLVPTEYVPAGILASTSGFSTVEAKHGPAEVVRVIVAEAQPAPNSAGAFMLDIDRGMEQESSPDLPVLMDVVDRLHEYVWTIFSAARGDKLDHLLKGNLQ
jgi:uncharacterized protein (TIGR04255 family)